MQMGEYCKKEVVVVGEVEEVEEAKAKDVNRG